MNPIPRTPPVPNLSEEEIQHIEHTVFWEQPPIQTPDIIFIFGASNDTWDTVATTCNTYASIPIVITGRLQDSIESNIIKHALLTKGIDTKRIHTEEISTNTLENVLQGKNLMEDLGLPHRHILFCCKTHHSGRCMRTLTKHFSGVKLSSCTYNKEYNGVLLSQKTWTQHEETRRRVYGEYLRIQEYAKKGDIAIVEIV